MELLQLKYFLTAAKYQHITKAAEELHIAQPALSQSIHRLETELGVPLFDRKNRGIALNASGKLLEKRLYPIMSALAGLAGELKEASEFSSHTIHLNLLAATTLITDCIIEYKSKHPNVNFQLSQIQNNDNADLCLSTTLPGEPLGPNAQVLLEEDFFLAVPADSPYALHPYICLEDTVNEGYISFAEPKPIRSICDQFCHLAGFTPRVIFESDNTESVRNLIAAGLGVGFWPRFSWGELTGHSNVVLLPIKSPVCRRDIILSYNKPLRDNPYLGDFYRHLSNYIRQLQHI